jgi:hypothetical protein
MLEGYFRPGLLLVTARWVVIDRAKGIASDIFTDLCSIGYIQRVMGK